MDSVDTRDLRHRVLRPHQRLDEMWLPGDDEPQAGHFAAFAPDREGGSGIVGTVSVFPELPPPGFDRHEIDQWWRLRGMAVDDDHRGLGIGADLLEAALAHMAQHGAEAIWCNARMTAAGFYLRYGFASVGEAWEEPALGLHLKMWRLVATS